MRAFAASMLAIATLFATMSPSESKPILKPAKYYGPIPKKSFSLRIGFLSGPTNEEMYTTINSKTQNLTYNKIDTEDFGNTLVIDGMYTIKLHPRFAVRLGSTLALLRSKSKIGELIPTNPDSLLDHSELDRSFDVDNFTIEGDAIYYFTDASVDEFQPYFGGGFSLWIPHAKYSDQRTDVFPDGRVALPKKEKTTWNFEAGIQGFIGALYYVSNSIAINVESRYHIAQSTFPLRINTVDGYKEVGFQVKYTGFVITVGLMKGF